MHKGVIEKVWDLAEPYLRGFRVCRLFGERFFARQYMPPNVDSHPHHTARTLVETIGGEVSMAVVRDFIDGIPKLAEEGEFRCYSTADGLNLKAFMWIKNDGVIELEAERIAAVGEEISLNGTGNEGLIRIAELTLKLNEFVAKYNNHVHLPSVVAPANPASVFVQEDYENTTVVHGGI